LVASMSPASRLRWLVAAMALLGACAQETTTVGETPSTAVDPTTTTAEPAAPATRLLYLGRANRDSEDPLDVWSAALDGTDRRIVAAGVPVKVDFYNGASLSPDGTQLAYVHRDDGRVHVRRLDTGDDVVASGHPSHRALWLDDTTIVYANRDDQTAWTVGPDGRRDQLLYRGELMSASYDGRALVLSADGSTLAVARDGEATPVAADSAAVLSGELAPDGEHAAWVEATDCRCPTAAVHVGRPTGRDEQVLPGGGDSYFGRTSPSWADPATVYAIRPEVAIDRTALDGEPVDVITFDGGYWDFLGAR